MRAIVLGAAAGGGFPQWNCGCANCVAVREERFGFSPRTQDSLAVTADGERFALVNASPDILSQIQRTRDLAPRSPRHTPLAAIVLTNGDMDHILGLFSLRESQPLALYTTASVWAGLGSTALIRTLQRFEGQLVHRPLEVGVTVDIADAKGEPIGIAMAPFATPGKLPVHFVGHARESAEDNVGLSMQGTHGAATSKKLAYAAACASLDGVDLAGHHTVLFDGTFFHEDELVRLGLGKARAKDMAHLPISGEEGSLAALAQLEARKIYTHVNNTNPILGPSHERSEVERAGWEIAYDGMEIVL